MPKSNAERQAAYRKRQADNGRTHALTIRIDAEAWSAFCRLCAHHRLTQRAMLTKLVLEADLHHDMENQT